MQDVYVIKLRAMVAGIVQRENCKIVGIESSLHHLT